MDQASALRRIVKNMKEQHAREPGKGARLISITSGKGGVGKTNIAVNMAISLARKGVRVLLIDADFGLSNVDVMMGLSPPYDLSHVIRGQKTVWDAVCRGPGGVGVVSGGSGLSELLNLSQAQLANILKHLLLLEDTADIVLVDTGAGVTPHIQRLIEASGEVIVVTTPEPTAIMDAYALVKNMPLPAGPPDARTRLIVNRADTVAEADATLQKFLAAVRLYLRRDIDPLGYVLSDPVVERAVRSQRPFVLSYPRSMAARNIEAIAWKLMEPGRAPEAGSGGLRGFLTGFLRGGARANTEK